MEGFKAYKYFMAIKLHFTTEKYDVFETNGRVSGSRATFEKRNDRFLFEKLGSRFNSDKDCIQFLVANFAYGNKNVVYSQESDDYFQTWNKRKESRTRMFEVDLQTLESYIEKNHKEFKDLYSIETGVPPLLNLYVGGHITLETMVILQDFDDYLSKWEPLIMLWHDHFLTIRKVKRFVKYDATKLKLIYDNFKRTVEEF